MLLMLRNNSLILLWILCNALAVGLGWYICSETRQWPLLGVVIGSAQALALLPLGWFALKWVTVTAVAWPIGLFLMSSIGAIWPGAFRHQGWVTMYGDDVTPAVALAPFVAVPVVALFQWLLLRLNLPGTEWVLWIAPAVCGFPVAGFVSLLLLDPHSNDFLGFIEPTAPMFWLLGGLFGLCTGWALQRIIPSLFGHRLPWESHP